MHKGKKQVMPPFLKEGDRIALVSPAYWVPQEVLGQAAEAIRGWGLQPTRTI
jgi:muramoyltetrapeptide carboxypeptidase